MCQLCSYYHSRPSASAENPGVLIPAALRAPASFLSSDRLMWAKIGPVGAVVAFAILIAIVCYITQTRRK